VDDEQLILQRRVPDALQDGEIRRSGLRRGKRLLEAGIEGELLLRCVLDRVPVEDAERAVLLRESPLELV